MLHTVLRHSSKIIQFLKTCDTWVWWLLSYRLDHIEALLVVHSAKHHVLVVKPIGLDGGDEELRPVGVGARVSHTEQPRAPVLHKEVLILKLTAVNARAACPVKILKISALKIIISYKIHNWDLIALQEQFSRPMIFLSRSVDIYKWREYEIYYIHGVPKKWHLF